MSIMNQTTFNRHAFFSDRVQSSLAIALMRLKLSTIVLHGNTLV